MDLLVTHNSPLTTFLLADFGRGVGVGIFLFITIAMWIIGTLAKAAQEKKRQFPTHSVHGNQPIQTTRQRSQSKQKNKAANRPPPGPGAVVRINPEPTISEPTQLSLRKEGQSELARNIRLMLTKSGAREAIVLNEILGKPKGLDM